MGSAADNQTRTPEQTPDHVETDHSRVQTNSKASGPFYCQSANCPQFASTSSFPPLAYSPTQSPCKLPVHAAALRPSADNSLIASSFPLSPSSRSFVSHPADSIRLFAHCDTLLDFAATALPPLLFTTPPSLVVAPTALSTSRSADDIPSLSFLDFDRRRQHQPSARPLLLLVGSYRCILLRARVPTHGRD